jgi:hypothetical protein
MSLLLKYGTNYKVSNHFFAFIIASYQFAINRMHLVDAVAIEDMYQNYFKIHGSNAELGTFWQLRI